MDVPAPAYSPGLGVAALMQQLKNGEITKMQLFQQIAKLQAATTTRTTSASPGAQTAPSHTESIHVPPVTTSYYASSSITPSVIGRGTPETNATAAPFVSFNYSPPRVPSQGAHNHTKHFIATAVELVADPVSSTTRFGTQPLSNDADILYSGVSHDKTPRLSVKEWMASKCRVNSTAGSERVPQQTSPSFSVPPIARTTSGEPSLFSFLEQPHQLGQDAEVVHFEACSRNVTSGDLHQQDHEGNSSGNAGDNNPHSDGFRDDSHDNSIGHKPTGMKSNGPAGISGAETRFHTRVTRWKSQKDALREQMKQQLLQNELDECTFAPKVNPKSTRVVAKLRGRQRSVGGGNGEGGVGCSSSSIAVSERLYQEADNYKAREELAARLKAEEEAELERECTFRPKINRNHPLTDKVKPKYMDIPKRESLAITPAAIEAVTKELQQCTFVPQVNPIGQDMLSAQLYLQQNIYERLSRPCTVAVESNVTDTRSDDSSNREYLHELDIVGSPRFRAQDDCYVRQGRCRSSTASEPRHCNQRPRSAGGIVTDEEKAERAKQFEDFLERQKFHEQARKKKIETTQQQLVPTHRPSINKKSQMMMENGRKGDFLERISQYAIRKEQDTVKNKAVRVSDPQCTFKPTINPTSAKRSARSVTELSRGDLLRRETTQRLMKLKMEQEEMASLTFRPELSRASHRVEGRLKILTSPDTYLQRIQQQSQAHMIKQRRAIQEKEMEEFSECTFRPRTIEAPPYVQRIARSVILTKALKKQQDAVEKANQKPEWK